MPSLSVRVVASAILVLTMLLGLAGCWDRRELEDMGFVMTIGLDAGKDGTLILTVQIAIPKNIVGGAGGGGGGAVGGGGGGKKVLVTSIETRSLISGLNLINTYVARRLTLVHAKAIIIGEDLAKQGVRRYLSAFTRFREARRTMFVIVTRGTAAELIRENQPLLEDNPAKFLELLINNSTASGLFPRILLHKFLVATELQTEMPIAILTAVNKGGEPETKGGGGAGGRGAAGDTVREKPAEKELAGRRSTTVLIRQGKPVPVPLSEGAYLAGDIPRVGGNKISFMGTAVFDGDKMVGVLNGDETRLLLMFRGEFTRGFISIPDPAKGEFFDPIDARPARRPHIRVRRQGNHFRIDADIALEGDILAIQSKVDYSRPEMIPVLEARVSRYLTQQAQVLVEKTQKDFKSDIFGFGDKVRHLMPTWDDLVKLHWLSKYPEADVRVRVTFKVRRVGTEFKPGTPVPSGRR
ncbi:MAG: Ger(x)C family spore germination protein [Firmicutes bacterium]|nr:Ger(x)C family spore germination protein [Bacillota bacterium]